MTRYWCQHALTFQLDAERVDAGVLLTVDGDSITSVEIGVREPPLGCTRLPGVTLPGIPNVHSHAFHRALRGRTQRERGSFWTWRTAMYGLAARLDPETYEALATATFAEMVLSGYTSVGEFHYLHHGADGVPYRDPNEVGRRLLRAAERAGIRITLIDACYLWGGIGVELDAVQKRFSDGTAEAWAARVDELLAAATPRARIGAGVHSVRAVDPAAIAAVARWAGERDVPLHAHLSEQPRENDDCLAAYGLTPTEVLDEYGALGERFTAIHATHLTDRDVDLLADRGCRCCICPTTERDLADGVGPTGALADAGVALCIGSDSHAVIDPFEETRATELDRRLVSLERGTHRPAELLWSVVVEGSRSLGWRAGRLTEGWLADFVTVDLGTPRTAGAGPDAASALVFAATAADVRDVVVGGEHVVRDGRHRALDVGLELERTISDVWRLP